MSAIAVVRPTLPHLSAPVAGIDPPALQDAISAILDREELAGPDECARLRRVRYDLERRAADMLDE